MPFGKLPAPASYLLRVIACAIAIFAGGRVGLLLVIDPGFLPTFWPPAAIAIAALLLGGNRLWPGVLVGGTLIYRSLAFDLSGRLDLPAGSAVGLAIAAGLTVQALLGATLIRRHMGVDTIPSSPADIIRFLILAGPIASLIEPACGVAILGVAGIAQTGDLAIGWWSWWIGDLLAVAVLVPLMLMLSSRSRRPWRRKLFGVALPVTIAASITAAFFAYALYRERDGIRAEFSRGADRTTAQLAGSIDGHIEVLHSISSFFASSIEVDRKEFETFVDRAFERHQGLRALEWAPRVRYDDVGDWVEFAKWNGYGDLQISENDAQNKMQPVARRAEYFPVFYLEPFATNRIAYGFDLASESKRRAAMQRARDFDQAVATSRVNLVQTHDSGTIVFVPLYENGRPRQTLEQRRLHLSGYAVGVLNVKEIMELVGQTTGHTGIVIRLFDRSSRDADIEMYCSHKEPHAPPVEQGLPRYDLTGLQVTNPVVVAGRKWEMHFQPTRRYLASRRGWRAWLVGCGGFALTGLLGAFLFAASDYTSRIEETVASRTTELSRANEHLEREVLVRRRAEEALSSQAQELSRSNEELQRFAHVASHDLREPLRAVSGFCQLLKQQLQGKLDDNCQAYVQHILDGSKRMQSLLDGLLAYSRVNTHGQPLQEFSSQQAFDSALANLHVAVQESGAVVTHGQLPVVAADPPQLMQLFQNLIGNAIKYRGSEKPQVHVDAVRDKESWVFSVTDTGIGIDAKHRDRIFIILQRLHTRNEYEGTGIGLAVCKRIVDRHGGRIWVEPGPGEGSIFRFSLPDKTHATVKTNDASDER